jgi:hypothetical protein
MTKRDRPRLNVTLAPDIKTEIKSIAEESGVPVSRLIEEVLREFLSTYEDDPMIVRRITKQIEDRKRESEEPDEETETIRNILDQMDKFE